MSLLENLAESANHGTDRLDTSKGGLVARGLCEIEAEEEERLAAGGYRFYASETREFAEASAPAVAAALEHVGWAAGLRGLCAEQVTL